MEEGNHDLEWEKEIYDEQGNTSPMAFKLRKGSGNMPQFHNLSGRGLIKSALNKIDYNHDGTTEHKEETEEEKKARLKKEAEEKAKENMKVVNTTTEVLDDGSIKTIEFLEGEGEAEDYEGPMMPNEEWKKFLKDYKEEHGIEWKDRNKKTDQRITITPPETTDVPKDPEPPEPRNIATLLNEYRVKNNIDMTYYDPEKPGGRQTHTPESYYEANKHFRDYVEAQQRIAVDAGQERLDQSKFDDVDQGTNITKTPLDMKSRKPIKGYVYVRKTNR